MNFQFQRISNKAYIEQSQVVEEFELELTRPIGIEVNDNEDGHVIITKFASDDILASKQLNIGDRIIAVDSITGSQMWPISNVDGLISATTSHLPGQSIRLRFQRVIQVGEYTSVQQEDVMNDCEEEESCDVDPTSELNGAVNGFRKLNTGLADTSTAAMYSTTTSSPIQSAGSNTHKLLLSRCRDVLRRYKADSTNAASTSMSTAMSLAPTLVADRVLETLGDASAPLDAKTLLLIMNAYTSCRVPDKAIHAFEVATGLSADGSTTTKQMKVNGSSSNKIVPDMQSLDLYTATTLLRAHALNGDYESAGRVLAALERKSITVNNIESSLSWPVTFATDVRCYNIVLAAAAKAKRRSGLDFALQIFERMADPNDKNSKDNSAVEKNIVSYNTMIAAFAKARRTQDALTVFYSMRQEKIKPDKYTYTAVLKALVANKDITGAQELLQEMKEVGIPLDIVTYNTMIKGLCDSLKLYEAQLLINEMESSRTKNNNKASPNSMTYCLLMNGLLKAQKPGPCLTLFETAAADERTTSLTENVQMYTTAVTAASRLGDYERALDLVVRMKKVGVKPNIKTLTALMSSCLEANQPETAVSVFTQITKESTLKGRVKPDGYALSYGIKAYCELGNFEEASRILSEQKDGYFDMSGKEIMFCYNYLINASLKQRRYDIARSALTELLASGYIPSKLTFKSILQALDIPHINKKRGELSNPEIVAQTIENNMNNFKFLLFTLDSLESRKLQCDDIFYSNILFECARLGALPKKIGSLLVKSKKRTNELQIEQQEHKSLSSLFISEQSNMGNNATVVVPTWASLYENWDSKKYRDTDPDLPMYRVRIGSKDIRQILNAEQAVSIKMNRRRSGSRNRQSGNKNKRMKSSVI